MRVYGHRANSVAAVTSAFDAGAYGVEVDVRRAADGTLVCGEATLADLLGAARGRVVCEVKNVPGEPDFDAPVEATAHALVAALGQAGGRDVTVSSFDWFAIEVARDAGLRTAFLTPPGITLDAALAYATDARHAECHVHWSAVLDDPAAVARAHEAGVEVVCWDVDASTVRSLPAVDAVIADDVAGVRAALDDD